VETTRSRRRSAPLHGGGFPCSLTTSRAPTCSRTPPAEAAFGAVGSRAIDTGFGAWSTGTAAPVLPTHVGLLPNGKILVVGGSQGSCCYKYGYDDVRLHSE